VEAAVVAQVGLLLLDRVVLQCEECLLLEARILKDSPWLSMMVERELMVIYEACQRGTSWEIMGRMNNARMPSSQGYGAQDEQCERSAWLCIEVLSIRFSLARLPSG
jgi:hypothetical protein